MTVHYDGPSTRRGERLRLQTRAYKGRPFTDLRRWVEKPDGDLGVTNAGVTVPRDPQELRRLGDAFHAAADLWEAQGSSA